MTGQSTRAAPKRAMTRLPRQARPDSVIARLPEWVRVNSQKYLLEAVQERVARQYLGRPGPVGRPGLQELFWKRIFVPLYRLLPWEWRRAIILAMPGSHRRGWQPDERAQPPAENKRRAA